MENQDEIIIELGVDEKEDRGEESHLHNYE